MHYFEQAQFMQEHGLEWYYGIDCVSPPPLVGVAVPTPEGP